MSSKSIFTNSILLYVRMFIVMGITLFLIRILLDRLGAQDYGIYNVVAGVVYTLNFLTAVMTSATQRFLSFNIGKGDKLALNNIFNASLIIYLLLSIIILIIGETLGYWFVNTQLVIPEDRIKAANWIFQFAIISFILSIISVPYRSVIISYEKMNIFSYITIFEAVLKLFFVILLYCVKIDKLIFYGASLLVVQIIVTGLFYISCLKQEECKLRICKDKAVYKSLVSFSGWTMYGTLANVGLIQGNTILINLFFGAVVNASRAVAQQVGAALSTFSSCFVMAVRPPMVKAYAENDKEYLTKLYYFSNKIIFYLLLVLFVPLILKTDYILNIWLKTVSDDAIIFSQLVLIYTFILTLHYPITIIVQASGKVKRYFTTAESFTLLSMPITYLFFKLHFPAYSTYIITIVLFSIAHLIRLIMLQKIEPIFRISDYFSKFFLKGCVIAIISCISAYIINLLIQNDFISLVLISLSTIFIIVFSLYFFVLSQNEKKIIFDIFQNRNS